MSRPCLDTIRKEDTDLSTSLIVDINNIRKLDLVAFRYKDRVVLRLKRAKNPGKIASGEVILRLILIYYELFLNEDDPYPLYRLA